MKEWERHIRHTHVDRKDSAWCGARLTQFDWCYLDIDHAAYSAPRDRIQPCPDCVVAAILALSGKPPELENGRLREALGVARGALALYFHASSCRCQDCGQKQRALACIDAALAAPGEAGMRGIK
jgi:hypothetical protein